MSQRRPAVPAQIAFEQRRAELASLGLAERFELIHRTNLWTSAESVSGLGSELEQTALLRREIPRMLAEVGAKSLLDIPCGDFHWMSEVALEVDYTGADIVGALIERHQRGNTNPRRRFLHLDLTGDPLPRADVVLCRDCLVHLSTPNVWRAIENLRASGSTWLLTTTFPGCEFNAEIEDGNWRMLNFELPPFSFGPPAALIVEGCTESDGAFADKSLGLWPIASLPALA